MRYANIIKDDMINGEGICTSFWTQGCPHRCPGCHNPETWSFCGGHEARPKVLIAKVLNMIGANGIQRNLSILGGEPLCEENVGFVCKLLDAAKEKYPTIKTYVWTGYFLEDLKPEWLENIDVLIDGKFEIDKRDITLKLRGSSNQRVLYKNIDF